MCVIMPNFIKIGQTVTEIWRFNGFQMAAVRHLGFVKFEFLMVGRLRDTFYISVPNFIKIGQTVTDISRFLWFFKMAAAAILYFQNMKYASLYQILSKSVKRLQIYSNLTGFFRNGGRPPSWICWAPIGTTHDDFSMVSIVVQNFVEMDAVVSITWSSQYFARLA